MTCPRCSARRREGGFALVAVLFVLLMLMGMAAAVHTNILGDTRVQAAHGSAVAGFYAAEAALNRGMGDYRNIFLAYREPTDAELGTHVLSLGPRRVSYALSKDCGGHSCAPPYFPYSVTIPSGKPFAGLSAEIYTYVAMATSELNTGDVETTIGSQFDVEYIPLFQFLAFYQRDLEINPGTNMTLNGPIFTNGNLYLGPTGALTVADAAGIPMVSVGAHFSVYRGRKDDQTSPRCSGTVTIDMLSDANNDGSFDPRTMTCGSSSAATSQTDSMLAPWLGSIRGRQPQLSVPAASAINRGPGNDAWERSDLRIGLIDDRRINNFDQIVVLDRTDAIDATLTSRLHAFMTTYPGRAFYNDVPNVNCERSYNNENCSGPAPQNDSYCNRNCYSPAFGNNADVYACAGALLPNIITACTAPNTMVGLGMGAGNHLIDLGGGMVTQRRGGFYNNRERAWVRMLNLNLHDLLKWNRDQPSGSRLIADPDDATEAGLVIYVTVEGQFSTTPAAGLGRERYGVRVFGSRNLDFVPSGNPTGVTIVSDQAIYVEGDYNVLNTSPNYDAAYPKQPAAFLGDTVNVLSSSWSGDPTGWGGCRNDCQSGRSLNSRPAATTYLNAAFLGGVPDTVPGNNGYNGGFENFPRFHEDWNPGGAGQQTLWYRGSFVSLGLPSHANGAWCGTGNACNIYNPPIRQWNYDPDFQTVNDLPPLTPRVVNVAQTLFTETFR